MTSEKIQAALAAIVESVKQMGAERFRAELDARGPGPLAHAFAEIEAFASDRIRSEQHADPNLDKHPYLLYQYVSIH